MSTSLSIQHKTAEKHMMLPVSAVQIISVASLAPLRNGGTVPDTNFHSHTAMQLLWLVSMNSN